jgi:putative ABC transport system permease protein
MAKALKFEFAEVKNVIRFRKLDRIVVRYSDKLFYESKIYFTDASVFDVFDFRLRKGDPNTVLTNPYSVVITEETADKYFGAENPVGKTLRFNNHSDYVVTGIMENLPENSHLEIDLLCSMSTLYAQKLADLEDWYAFNNLSYVLLKENYDYKKLENKFPNFIKKYIGQNYKAHGKNIKLFLHPLTKIHLYSHLEGYPPGRITGDVYYSLLAFFLLVIASINFINLSIARAATRAKEIGLRKVVGAKRSSLIQQFIFEALIISTLSVIIAFGLVEILLPVFSMTIGQELKMSFISMPWLLAAFAASALIVGLLTGGYPAFYLSRFKPVSVLKGGIRTSTGKSRFRSFLVVFQFMMSSLFIIQTGFLRNQIIYMKNKDLGFSKKNVVVLPLVDEDSRNTITVLKKELKIHAGVLNVAAASTIPGWNISRDFKIPEGFSKDEMQLMDEINVDDEFILAMGINLISGRNFAKEYPTDKESGVIVNETAIKKFKWKNPIGKTIQFNIGSDKYKTGKVVGVVKDFHLASLYRVIEPLFISNDPDKLNYLIVRIQPNNIPETIDFIKIKWQAINTAHPFNYFFLDDSFDHYFRVLERIMNVMLYFTLLAILISCLGIFALTSFTVERRTKEIGIRKVLGASTKGIIFQLNKEIMKLIAIATILAFLFMQLPFYDIEAFFPYMAPPDSFIYIKTLILIWVIALGTIMYQAVRAATANPVESLRYE